MRALHEAGPWKTGVVVDLTYSTPALEELNLKHQWEYLTQPDKYPCREDSLDHREVTNFFWRLRKTLRKSGREFTWAVGAEYGDPMKTHRPHFHVILYGLKMSDEKLIFDTWGRSERQGQDIQPFNGFGSVSYVSKYIQKQSTNAEWQKLYPYKKKPYYRTGRGYTREKDGVNNRGFGYQYAIDHKKQIENLRHITVKGTPFTVPAYYAAQLEIDWDTPETKQRQQNEEEIYTAIKERYRKENGDLSGWVDYSIYLLEQEQDQKLKNNIAKITLRDPEYAQELRKRKLGKKLNPQTGIPDRTHRPTIHPSIARELQDAEKRLDYVLAKISAPP